MTGFGFRDGLAPRNQCSEANGRLNNMAGKSDNGVTNRFQVFATQCAKGWRDPSGLFWPPGPFQPGPQAGPYFHYSDTWQLVIHTAITGVRFLMVFLIQNNQARAMHRKLDQLIRSLRHAHHEMIDIENEELAALAPLQDDSQRM